MADIFSQPQFVFPYDGYRFPGQNSDERILFVARENPVMLWVRQAAVISVGAAVLMSGWLFAWVTESNLGVGLPIIINFIASALGLVVATVGWWWMTTLWQKSLCILTTKRLTKFVYSTPVNRHSLSLPLDMIVDTGAYTKGFIQAFFQLGTFTARSSASSSGVSTDDGDRINKKYFYIENVAMAEDLQQYISKLLTTYRSRQGDLEGYRPFIPHFRGHARQAIIDQYPEYWS